MQLCRIQKNLTRFGIFLVSGAAIYSYYCYCYYNAASLEHTLADRSSELLHKYDPIRKRSELSKLKLSTNTYDSEVLLRNDFDHGSIYGKENATILMLVRNFELPGALASMRSLEDRFNRRYHYDWTFLNDVPFDEEFIIATTAMASGKTQYALIPPQDWDCPRFINETAFEQRLQVMDEKGVLYGGSRSYRNMCRFNSGYFFRQEILNSYDYYFRVEPDVEYFCDFPYDPFRVMRVHNKKYGFVIAIHEYEDTIPTLWETVEEFIDEQGSELGLNMEQNAYKFITDKEIIGKVTPIIDSNSGYNLCHFWSNFEIGDLNFFRSEKYLKYFQFLDSKGGFYYERWGDAPVHTVGASLLLDRDEIIHFDELGYMHAPFSTCPAAYYMKLVQRCQCSHESPTNIGVTYNSCLMRWWKNGEGKKFVKEL